MEDDQKKKRKSQRVRSRDCGVLEAISEVFASGWLGQHIKMSRKSRQAIRNCDSHGWSGLEGNFLLLWWQD